MSQVPDQPSPANSALTNAFVAFEFLILGGLGITIILSFSILLPLFGIAFLWSGPKEGIIDSILFILVPLIFGIFSLLMPFRHVWKNETFKKVVFIGFIISSIALMGLIGLPTL
ncbi:MAG: hypothetical protein COB85_07560 [Bacteroidetes bacterium]|nr:MAG: hypothetical protein COB85_07560 [Bacteroidota bacterium]